MNYVETINLEHICVGEENWEEGIFLSRQIKKFPRIIIVSSCSLSVSFIENYSTNIDDRNKI